MTPAWPIVTHRLTVEPAHPAESDFSRDSITSLRVSRRADAVIVGELIVRVEPDEPTAEVTIVVVEEVRGLGYAFEMLGRLVDQLLDAHRFDRVIAVVPEAHDRARRLFERTGFGAVARDGAELVYSRLRITVSDEPDAERIAPPDSL